MIKLLLRVGITLVIGIVIYNYFLGTPEEKESSKAIFREVKELGKASWTLLKSEKAKLDEGKYDTAIDKIGGLYRELESKARTNKDRDALTRLVELERQRRDLETRLSELNEHKAKASTPTARKAVQQEEAKLKADLRRLLDETETLMGDMEKG